MLQGSEAKRLLRAVHSTCPEDFLMILSTVSLCVCVSLSLSSTISSGFSSQWLDFLDLLSFLVFVGYPALHQLAPFADLFTIAKEQATTQQRTIK